MTENSPLALALSMISLIAILVKQGRQTLDFSGLKQERRVTGSEKEQ